MLSVPRTVRSGGSAVTSMLYRARFCQYLGPGRPSGDLVPFLKASATSRGMGRPPAPTLGDGGVPGFVTQPPATRTVARRIVERELVNIVGGGGERFV